MSCYRVFCHKKFNLQGMCQGTKRDLCSKLLCNLSRLLSISQENQQAFFWLMGYIYLLRDTYPSMSFLKDRQIQSHNLCTHFCYQFLLNTDCHHMFSSITCMFQISQHHQLQTPVQDKLLCILENRLKHFACKNPSAYKFYHRILLKFYHRMEHRSFHYSTFDKVVLMDQYLHIIHKF